MRKQTNENTDDTDEDVVDGSTIERDYDSTDSERSTVAADAEPEPPKRQYKRKPVEEDKRRRGNHERTERQKAATARMLEVRREMNAKRKATNAKQIIERGKSLEKKVSVRKAKQRQDDKRAAKKLAGSESDTASESDVSSSDDEPSPPRRPRKHSARNKKPTQGGTYVQPAPRLVFV